MQALLSYGITWYIWVQALLISSATFNFVAPYIYGSNIFLCLKMKIWASKSVKVQRLCFSFAVIVVHGALTRN